MQEIELYTLYHTLSMILYALGAAGICAAVVLFVMGLGGIKELKEKFKPKPSLEPKADEPETDDLQNIAEVFKEEPEASLADLGLAVTEALAPEEAKSETPQTTVLEGATPSVKFIIMRKIVITHDKGEEDEGKNEQS